MTLVLVTDGEQRSSLAIVRSLGRAGRRVAVTSYSGRSLAGASRFAGHDFRLPDPVSSAGRFQEAVIELVARERPDVVIPTTDVAATLILPLRDQLGGALIPFPDLTTWERGTDKAGLAEVGTRIGVPVPRQVLVEAPEDVGDRRDEITSLGYPLIVKPHRSAVRSDDTIRKVGVSAVANEEELGRTLAALPEAAFPVLLQERIEGPGLGGFFLSREGRPVAAFAHRRLREKPPSGGVSVLRESVALRPDVRAHSEALLEALEWSGVAMVEFKEDAKTGTPYLMEINGRFWGSLQLAIDAGVDFPELLLQAFEGEARAVASPVYDVGIESRWLLGDLDHLIAILKRPELPPESGLEPGRLAAVMRFLTPRLQGRHLEVERVSDLRPALRELATWLRALRH